MNLKLSNILSFTVLLALLVSCNQEQKYSADLKGEGVGDNIELNTPSESEGKEIFEDEVFIPEEKPPKPEIQEEEEPPVVQDEGNSGGGEEPPVVQDEGNSGGGEEPPVVQDEGNSGGGEEPPVVQDEGNSGGDEEPPVVQDEGTPGGGGGNGTDMPAQEDPNPPTQPIVTDISCSSEVDSELIAEFSCEDGKNVAICHVPPGNPMQAKLKILPKNSLNGHMNSEREGGHRDFIVNCKKFDEDKVKNNTVEFDCSRSCLP